MDGKRVRRKYDRQFKLDAVDLVIRQGRAVAQVARDLGVDATTLHTWVRDAREKQSDAFPGNGNASGAAAELKRMARELAIVREERDILKKALAVFSRRPQ